MRADPQVHALTFANDGLMPRDAFSSRPDLHGPFAMRDGPYCWSD